MKENLDNNESKRNNGFNIEPIVLVKEFIIRMSL